MNNSYETNWVFKVKKVRASTPFLFMDLSKVDEKITEFTDYFPECKVYYALKAFGDGELVEHIRDKVSGFDVASYGEFELLKKRGVGGDRVLFSNPVKIPAHISKAYKEGVNQYSFDSHNELIKLAKYAPGCEVYLRIKVSDHGSAFPLSSKFGANLEHAVPLMDTAISLGLKPVGITFHVGSQSENLESWDIAIEKCGLIMKRLEKHDIKLRFLNIGGGFPVMYLEKIPKFKSIVKQIRTSLVKHLPYEVEIIAEPGRFIVAEAGLLVASVIGREKRNTADWLFTDVGSFNGIMEPLEINNWKYPMFTDKSLVTGSIPSYFTVTGPTCDPSDTYGYNVPFPSGIEVGDKVYIGSAGAYTTVYASNFNGFPAPRVIYGRSNKD